MILIISALNSSHKKTIAAIKPVHSYSLANAVLLTQEIYNDDLSYWGNQLSFYSTNKNVFDANDINGPTNNSIYQRLYCHNLDEKPSSFQITANNVLNDGQEAIVYVDAYSGKKIILSNQQVDLFRSSNYWLFGTVNCVSL